MKTLTGMARNLFCTFYEKTETFVPAAEIIFKITESNPFGGGAMEKKK